jgi:hypothetical protein
LTKKVTNVNIARTNLHTQVLRAYIYVLLRAGSASLALETINKAIAQSAHASVEVVSTEHTQQQEQSDAAVVDTTTASAALLLYKADALLCLAESGYDSSNDSSNRSSTPQETSKHILDTTQAGMSYHDSTFKLCHTVSTHIQRFDYTRVFDT